MAGDMFLELEGIDGESTDSEYSGKIDVLSWDWGVSQSGTFHGGGGGGAGKANFQDISVRKWVDKSSMILMKFVATGRHIPTGKLIVRKAGDGALEYIIIELKKILVSTISIGGTDGEERLSENITLNFAEFKSSYIPQNEDGTGDAAIDCAFNIAANKEC